MAEAEKDNRARYPSKWSWLPWTLLGYLLISFVIAQAFFSMSIKDNELPIIDGVLLICVTICVGFELARRSDAERKYFEDRMTWLEQRMESQGEELRALKEGR